MAFQSVRLWFLILKLVLDLVNDPDFTWLAIWILLVCLRLLLTSIADLSLDFWSRFCLSTWYLTACMLWTSAYSWLWFCLRFGVFLIGCYWTWLVIRLHSNLTLVYPRCTTSCTCNTHPSSSFQFQFPGTFLFQCLCRPCINFQELFKRPPTSFGDPHTGRWHSQPLTLGSGVTGTGSEGRASCDDKDSKIFGVVYSNDVLMHLGMIWTKLSIKKFDNYF